MFTLADSSSDRSFLPKAPTGIEGLDEITAGGLPRGRPTLVCGGAGSGKTLLAMEFIVRGATEYNEPGVFVSFEETAEELTQNVASLGFDLPALIEKRLLNVDYVRVERSEIEETGEYDLEGLFIRLGYAIDSVGAKRVALDTLEALFSGLQNEAALRAELRRLFRWLKDRGVTAVITAERGPHGELTRHGLEEYVSDCVIVLDHRVHEQVSTRRLRVVKYRGSRHGTNEYPFLVTEHGFSVLPVTSIGLTNIVSPERISTGIPGLDSMLEGKGYYTGSTILVSGGSGTGKTTVAAAFAQSVCKAGGRCLYFAFEESPDQIMRNMRSVGIDLSRWVDAGLLGLVSTRPTFSGLEAHLVAMHEAVREFKPVAVVIDPVSSFAPVGDIREIQSMMMRLIDFLKAQGLTTLLTGIPPATREEFESGISSLIDTWIVLRQTESGEERVRRIFVLKSRGMNHSNRLHHFALTNEGFHIVGRSEARGTGLAGEHGKESTLDR